MRTQKTLIATLVLLLSATTWICAQGPSGKGSLESQLQAKVAELATNGKVALRQLSGYPQPVKVAALELCREPALIVRVASVAGRSGKALDEAMAGYPATSQQAARTLAGYPEVLELLQDNLVFVGLLGAVHADDPTVLQGMMGGGTGQAPSVTAAAPPPAQDDWALRLQENPEANKQFEAAVAAFHASQASTGTTESNGNGDVNVNVNVVNETQPATTNQAVIVNGVPSPAFSLFVMGSALIYADLYNEVHHHHCVYHHHAGYWGGYYNNYWHHADEALANSRGYRNGVREDRQGYRTGAREDWQGQRNTAREDRQGYRTDTIDTRSQNRDEARSDRSATAEGRSESRDEARGDRSQSRDEARGDRSNQRGQTQDSREARGEQRGENQSARRSDNQGRREDQQQNRGEARGSAGEKRGSGRKEKSGERRGSSGRSREGRSRSGSRGASSGRSGRSGSRSRGGRR